MNHTTHSAFQFIDRDPLEKAIAKRVKKQNKGSHHIILLGILLVAYLPVLLLSAFDHTLNRFAGISFIGDFGLQFRFLIAIPILVLSKPFIQRTTAITGKYIHDVLLEDEEGRQTFLTCIEKIRAANASWIPKATIIAVVVLLTATLYYFSTHDPALVYISGWFGKTQQGEFYPSKAYLWYTLVSMTVFRFTLVRWFWFYSTWVWLLIKVAGCKLKLTPHHGDKACGLSMLIFPQSSFNLFFVALAVTSSGMAINEMVYINAPFETIALEIGILVGTSFAMLLAPYLFFTPKLLAAKRITRINMSSKSQQLSEDYETEWIRTRVKGNADEKPDPSVMIDFYSTYEITEKIRPVVFDLRDLIPLAVPIALAFLPTLLTRFSFKELLEIALRFVA